MALLVALSVYCPLCFSESYEVSAEDLDYLEMTLDNQQAQLQEWKKTSEEWQRQLTELNLTIIKQNDELIELRHENKDLKKSRRFWMLASIACGAGAWVTYWSTR